MSGSTRGRAPNSGRRTLAQQVYADLREWLISGMLTPGEKVSLRTAAKRPPLTDQAVGNRINTKFALFEQTGISCRVAEGRALRRHGNRNRIIYPVRQVPTLARQRGP